MSKIKRITSSLTFNIALSITALLIIFGIIVATIGYIKFNDTLTERYNDGAYATAISTTDFVKGDDVLLYFEEGKAIYEQYGNDLTAKYKAELAAKKAELGRDLTPAEQNDLWAPYVYELEEHLSDGIKDDYRNLKASLQSFCVNQDVAILYIIIPDKNDYSTYYSVIDCVNPEYLPYTPWMIGADQHHAPGNEYDAYYKDIMENDLKRATVKRTNNLNGADPYVNSLVPIHDSTGKVVGIIVAQQTMKLLNKWGRSYILLIVLTTIILSVLSVGSYILLVRSQFVTPIKKIMEEAQRFAKENSVPEQPIMEDISHIHEISTLAAAINDMEDDTLKYIENLSDAISEKQKIGAELSIAKSIQEAMLPSNFPAFPDRFDFDLYASMIPAKEVGGDFYDFFLVDDDHLAMIIADVSGKGVPAALFMMVTKILIYERARMGESPSQILTFVNERICEKNPADMFVTVWLGILELSTGKVVASNAGHDNPAVLRNGKFDFIKSKRGVVVGAFAGSKYTNFEFKLAKNDIIYLFTDGVPEATNVSNQMFTLDRTLETLNEMTDKTPKEIVDAINKKLDLFTGDAPRFDDTTMLCIKYIGSDKEIDRELVVVADIDNLPKVTAFATSVFEEQSVPKKTTNQLLIALEEVFANVAHYAYPPKTGDCVLHVTIADGVITIVVKDSGTPYNPLEKEDPDVTLSANEREEGGLGIYMTKKLVDNLSYEYVDGQNILTLEKKI